MQAIAPALSDDAPHAQKVVGFGAFRTQLGTAVSVQHFTCDASAWSFSIVQDDCQLVAILFFRGEQYGPEFRAANQAALQRAIARWLLLHADVAGGLH